MAILVPNVRISDESDDPIPAIAKALDVARDEIVAHTLVRRSLDARHGKQRWLGVYRVDVRDEAGLLARKRGLRSWSDKDDVRYGLVDGAAPTRHAWPASTRFIVVGAGPAGMFAALYLAEAGASVLLLERGGPVAERVTEVNGFWRGQRELDDDNNLVFGEGGAGTFSDGKIYTRRRDGEVGYILRRFVDFGARQDILEEGWAHLGTDKVRAILPVFRERLKDLGVEVRFHARVDDLVVEHGRAAGVVLADGTVERGTGVIVAAGHSARDTMSMLVRRGAEAQARPIAIGVRIEHPQRTIDDARYGADKRGDLPAASYRLAYHPDRGHKARTFCMCPGGMVVPAMSARGQVVVNGMSFAAQRSYWANAAVIVEVEPTDYGGTDPLAGYAWQEAIERHAFELGGGAYAAPAQRLVDLFDHTVSGALPRVSYPLGVTSSDLSTLFPGFVVKTMVEAVRAFDRKLPGYISDEAVLVAPETRTTSPVRLLRTEGYASTTIPGLYPVGEGAGYGGGIVSCALDGLKAAAAIVDAAT